jgi:NADH-quinone oxidoreductase subunit M
MLELFSNIEFIILVTLGLGLLAWLLGKWNAQAGSIVTIFGSLFVLITIGYFGYVEHALDNANNWVPQIHYSVTELGLFFAVIVAFTFTMVSFFNPFFVDKYKFKAAYSILYLFSLAGTVGVFFTNDIRYLFFFFELVVWTSLFLIPMGRSRKAASWYYGFSAFGSFSLLFALLLIYKETAGFNMIEISNMSGSTTVYVFILLMVAAFAKLGAFPLHIWLPKVLRDAPDPITAVFSGGLEKMGAFVAVLGLVKLANVGAYIDINGMIGMNLGNLFIAGLGALTIIFGTLMAIRQDDAKKLLAYSSMSNGGYILVALSMMSSAAIAGGLYHIVAHALASTAAFLAIGAVSYFTGTTKISELGGIIHKMPVTYVVYLIAIISMAGIPPMGGFISKWLIFQSVLNKGLILISIAVFFGSIGSFLYVFRPLAALFLGQERTAHEGKVKEAPFFMLVPMVILSLIILATGVVPNYFLAYVNDVIVSLNIDGLAPLTLDGLNIIAYNTALNPTLIAIVFATGVFVAFIIFILLKKSYKVDLMDTYTAGNFVWTQDILHYTVDFYAPLERLYEKQTTIMKKFYNSLANKVLEFGQVIRYYFFTNKPEVTVFFILIVIAFLLWGDIL